MDPEPEINPHFQIATRDWDLILSRYPSTIQLVAVSKPSAGSTIAFELGRAGEAGRIATRLYDASRWLSSGIATEDPLVTAVKEALQALRLGPPEMAAFILERAIGRDS